MLKTHTTDDVCLIRGSASCYAQLEKSTSYLFVCSNDRCLRFCDFHNGRARTQHTYHRSIVRSTITFHFYCFIHTRLLQFQHKNLTRFSQNAALVSSRGVRAQHTAYIAHFQPSAFPSALKYPHSVLPILYTWAFWPNPCRCANASYPPCRGCAAFHFPDRSSTKMRPWECQHAAWIARETA